MKHLNLILDELGSITVVKKDTSYEGENKALLVTIRYPDEYETVDTVRFCKLVLPNGTYNEKSIVDGSFDMTNAITVKGIVQMQFVAVKGNVIWKSKVYEYYVPMSLEDTDEPSQEYTDLLMDTLVEVNRLRNKQVSNASIIDGELLLTFVDNTTQNVGQVVGSQLELINTGDAIMWKVKTDVEWNFLMDAQVLIDAVNSATDAIQAASDTADLYQQVYTTSQEVINNAFAASTAADYVANAKIIIEQKATTVNEKTEIVLTKATEVANNATEVANNATEVTNKASEVATHLQEVINAAAEALISKNASKQSEDSAKDSETEALSAMQIASQALSDLLSMLGTDIATLTDGKLTPSQIPPLSINDVFSVANTAEMLLLTAQRGDVALIIADNVVTDSYMLAADDTSVLTNWKKLGVSYVANAGHATTADEATNATMINGHRVVYMTQAQYDVAVKDAETVYMVGVE